MIRHSTVSPHVCVPPEVKGHLQYFMWKIIFVECPPVDGDRIAHSNSTGLRTCRNILNHISSKFNK